MIALLLVPYDPAMREDLEFLGVKRTAALAGCHDLETVLARRLDGQERVAVIASPLRRWSDVMEALRLAAVRVMGDVVLQFYQPKVRIALKGWMPETGWRIAVQAEEYEDARGPEASRLVAAVRAGVRDLEAAEQRAADLAFLDRARAAGCVPAGFH